MKTKRTKSKTKTDPRPMATFTVGKLTVRIALDHPDPVMRQVAETAAYRMAHRLGDWSVARSADPARAASADYLARYISESEEECRPALRHGLAVVQVAK